MVVDITDIPREILGIVCSFLTKHKISSNLRVWRNFLNSCKSFLQFKSMWIYYNLNKYWSIKYLLNLQFSNQMKSLIHNSALQIQLRLNTTEFDMFKEKIFTINNVFSIEFFSSHLPNLPFFKGVSDLKLRNCELLMDSISGSSGLESLSIVNCKIAIPSLFNVNFFPSLTSLEIIGYNYLLDVSCFNKIPHLNFNGCENIIGLEALREVEVLCIRHCSSVEDISMLKNIISLDISFCSSLIHLGYRKNLRTLFVCPTTISLLSQSKTHGVNLIVEGDVNNMLVTQFLEPYHYLTLLNNSHLEAFEGFPFLLELTLINLENLRSIAQLPFLKRLSVDGCEKLELNCLHTLPKLFSLDIGGKGYHFHSCK